MRSLVLPVLLCLYFCSHAQDTIRTFILGDTAIHLVVHTSAKQGPLYYNMHDDENTSVEAAIEVIQAQGGTLYELVHTGERFIMFRRDTVLYEIDPNRIYTDAGVWRELRRVYLRDSMRMVTEMRMQDSLRLTLMRDSLFQVGDSVLFYLLSALQQAGIPVEVRGTSLNIRLPMPPMSFNARDTSTFELVRAFADTLLSIMQVDRQRLVVALHNNRDRGYSMESYLWGNVYEIEAQAVYRGWHPDPDDFYFVTERHIYEALQPNNYHIILQDNARVTDDGSLSVYCGRRGIPYVNVEAQHGHLEEQKEMLQIMLERLGW